MGNETVLRERLRNIIKSNKVLYNIAMTVLQRKPISGGITKDIQGRNNKFQSAGTAIFINSKIHIRGNDNEIKIDDYCCFNNVNFLIIGNGNKITISESVKFGYGGSLHIEDDNCLIDIGDNSTFEDVHIAATEPGSQILIGRDCMFAYDIDVRTGDSHSIIDTTTSKRINHAKNVRIADHVWITAHCTILKGVEIEKNSIIATRSVITRSYTQGGIIIGGSPSKILKDNITWDRKRIIDL
ncbi:MAG: hypothetical protein WEB30_09610 [Cyclobacteriaceae bacterium]